MSHEIRTPMNGVIGMASLLLTTELSDEQKDYLETMRSSGEYLLTVINDILDFSKVEAGQMTLESLSFDIREVVQSTADLLSVQAKSKHLPIVVNVDEQVPQLLLGDPGRWRQVLTNLLGNAIKFTAQGSIRVSLSAQNTEGKTLLRTEVIDTGIGIAQDKLDKLFMPFSQVDASITRQFGGTGLGLSICRYLAQLMGGEIGVHSQERQGSCFWFTVSMAIDTDVSKPSLATTVMEPSTKTTSLRILLVEDNIVNQKVAMAMLRKLGHHVDAVCNGEEAVQQLGLLDYDVVLMDCQMPVMDGFAATRVIRAGGRVRHSKIPIIALTANVLQEDKDACYTAGMDAFLPKPIQMQALMDAVAIYAHGKV